MKLFLFLICIVSAYLLFCSSKTIATKKYNGPKIKGVNLVSPKALPSKFDIGNLDKLKAEWIALTPYAFMSINDPTIYYNIERNWWGDKSTNIKTMAKMAKAQGLKILLKPHFWVDGQGWPGDYNLSRKKWKIWEVNYRNFIIKQAQIAEELDIEMLSIGVEFKTAIKRRAKFWNNLIDEIRLVYSGQLIYAANWDNYQSIQFWNKLDYVGIDAYFPLSPSITPTVDELNRAWIPVVKEIDRFYRHVQIPILFTEYGYRSTDKAAWQQWEIENIPSEEKVNLLAQTNAYKAFYQSVWHKEWFAGGFVWKCYAEDAPGGRSNSNYTPQNKPAQFIIAQWYEK